MQTGRADKECADNVQTGFYRRAPRADSEGRYFTYSTERADSGKWELKVYRAMRYGPKFLYRFAVCATYEEACRRGDQTVEALEALAEGWWVRNGH